MQVKKFEAPTIQEALEVIKRELGPEAIILQTKKHKKGFGLMSQASVEVTAAVSERSLKKKALLESKLPEPNRDALKQMSAQVQAEVLDRIETKQQQRQPPRDQVSAVLRTKRYVEIDEHELPQPTSKISGPPQLRPGKDEVGLLSAIRSLQSEVAALKKQATPLQDEVIPLEEGADEALKEGVEKLTLAGVERSLALQVMRKVLFEYETAYPNSPYDPEALTDLTASEIMGLMSTKNFLESIPVKTQAGPEIVALVGPTGVGKTTTLAKVASVALLNRELRVGLINLDTFKVAAHDHLGSYAKILGLPFRTVTQPEELHAALRDFRSLDLVLIDTAGRSPKDQEGLKEIQVLLASVEAQTQKTIRRLLVMSATTRDLEMRDLLKRFSGFSVEGLVVSKLDEVILYGPILNLAVRSKLPLIYFTTGQRVPEDLENATSERIAGLILDLV
jgi:flagellar biosynthesis protein FlhF